jgi:hypothetical protein
MYIRKGFLVTKVPDNLVDVHELLREVPIPAFFFYVTKPKAFATLNVASLPRGGHGK